MGLCGRVLRLLRRRHLSPGVRIGVVPRGLHIAFRAVHPRLPGPPPGQPGPRQDWTAFMTVPSLDGRRFRAVADVAGGEVGTGTIFTYHQDANEIWGTYAGGSVRRG